MRSDHALGWRELRSRARRRAALEFALTALTVLGLALAGCIGCDFVEHIPPRRASAD